MKTFTLHEPQLATLGLLISAVSCWWNRASLNWLSWKHMQFYRLTCISVHAHLMLNVDNVNGDVKITDFSPQNFHAQQ